MNLNTVMKARNFNLPNTQIHLLESADCPGHSNARVLTGSQVFRNPLTPSISRMDQKKYQHTGFKFPPLPLLILFMNVKQERETFSEVNSGAEIPSVPEKNIP